MTSKEILDIVALVQNNPLTKLHGDYGSKIISKIQQRFSPEIQQFYIANLYCYLNFNSKTDFPVIFDRIWKWLGYTRIDHCKTVLLKHFKLDIDYKIENFASEDAGAKTEKPASEDAGAGLKLSEEGKNLGGAGMNREYITLTINCFKKLCLKSKTSNADKIHEYYVELEDLMNELVIEQAAELQLKLQDKDKQLFNKDVDNHNTIIMNFKDKQVVYLIEVEKNILKFGYTKDIEQRFTDHKSEFGQDIKIKIIHETIYNREFEDMIKNHFKKNIFTKKFKKFQTELIQLTDKFTYNDLKKEFDKLKHIVNENFIPKLIKEITDLKIYIAKLEQEHLTTDEKLIILKLTEENHDLRFKIIELEAKLNNNQSQIEKEKLELRKQELDLRYNKHSKSKNIFASEHRFIDGIEHKFCMGIVCREETGEDGQWLIIDLFGKSAQNKDGFKTICKKCRSINEKSYNKQDQKMSEEELKDSKANRSIKLRTKIEDNKKICSKCNELKELSNFQKNGTYITGEYKYHSHCTECQNKSKTKKRTELLTNN